VGVNAKDSKKVDATDEKQGLPDKTTINFRQDKSDMVGRRLQDVIDEEIKAGSMNKEGNDDSKSKTEEANKILTQLEEGQYKRFEDIKKEEIEEEKRRDMEILQADADRQKEEKSEILGDLSGPANKGVNDGQEEGDPNVVQQQKAVNKSDVKKEEGESGANDEGFQKVQKRRRNKRRNKANLNGNI